ncbi:toxin-antitoxin system YwqK family antitoxin [Flavobacterium hercynium]|uniref:Uncharacterized protein n=1 Tax=Flavobacterium hercynium TaxID=387094 RepID=A0A226H5F8_9FLAO|nr:hypothetical protein [Flavobacterium hercynium]OXA88700.1 hypothetical protein B0A66_14945 [Flavobacterium hercynium]SMP34492.1 hypothetical protein SAMN06265346_11820 [Flavobacterium hercynium]
MKKKYKIILTIIAVYSVCVILLILSLINKKPPVLKRYIPETKDTLTTEFVIRNNDTIPHGKYIVHNENGNKTDEGSFVDGHIKGKSIHYFDNEMIESICYYKSVKIKEECTFYYFNEKTMKYYMYNDLGELEFIIYYDKFGNVESYEGTPLLEIYQYKVANKEKFKTKIEQHLKVGDTLKYEYLIANIPNAKRTFKIKNLDVDNTKVDLSFRKTSQVGIEVEETLTQKGINTIQATVKYEFNDKEKTIINDTLSFQVTVN